MKNWRLPFLVVGILLIITVGIQPVFAEKIVSIQKTVDIDRESLTDSISSLEKYSQILPDYIQSSKLTKDNTANMKIGIGWITIDMDIKFAESNDKVTLEVISGDFRGTKLYVTMSEKTKDSTNEKTDVSAEMHLQRSWHMGVLTSFVSDNDIKSMLNTSLNGLVEYAKNPPTYEKAIEEKERFCIFGLCF